MTDDPVHPRHVLVTGAGSGIGAAASRRLAASGAAICVVDRSADAAAATAACICDDGGTATAVTADVTDPAQVDSAVAAAVDGFGGLDALVCSAGIQRYGDAVETTPDAWHEVIETNLSGAFYAAHSALPHLRRSAGAIVFVSSVQGHVTQKSVVAYTASKGGLHAMTRALAVDEAAFGVRVNSVSPGSVDTAMLRASARTFAEDDAGAELNVIRWGAAHPLGRVARAEEVAAVIEFLVGPSSSFVTGEDIRVDGGLLSALSVAIPDE